MIPSEKMEKLMVEERFSSSTLMIIREKYFMYFGKE